MKFLTRLAALGFPSLARDILRRPVVLADGLLREIVSFLPGREVGWDSEPSMGTEQGVSGRGRRGRSAEW